MTDMITSLIEIKPCGRVAGFHGVDGKTDKNPNRDQRPVPRDIISSPCTTGH